MPEDNSSRKGAATKNAGQQRQEREEIDYTHFISVPVRDAVIRQNYDNLKQSIIGKKLGVQDSQFTEAPTLHLTVLMLDLKDPVRLNAAKTVLQGLERDIQMNLLGAVGG